MNGASAFFSSVTGKILIPQNMVLIGDEQGHSTPVEVLPMSFLPALAKDNVWLGGDKDRPAASSVLPLSLVPMLTLEKLPALTKGSFWKGSDSDRPEEHSLVLDDVGLPTLANRQIWLGNAAGAVIASSDFNNLWDAIDKNLSCSADPAKALKDAPAVIDVPEKIKNFFKAFDLIEAGPTVSLEEQKTVKDTTVDRITSVFNSLNKSINLVGDTADKLVGTTAERIEGVFNAFNTSITLFSPPKTMLKDGKEEIYFDSIENTAKKIESVFNAFNTSIVTEQQAVSSTADKITGVFNAFNSSIKGVGDTADKISGVFDAFNNSIRTVEGSIGRTADKITSVFHAFDNSIQGVGTTADKISGVFNAFTNAVNSVTSIPQTINDTATAIHDVFNGFTNFSVSFGALAEKAGYEFGKGFVLGAFCDQIITYNDLGASRVIINGDMSGYGYINTPRFSLFTPQSWWTQEVSVKLNDILLEKAGRAINIVYDNAMPYGKVGVRQKSDRSSSAFNVCSTDTGSNYWSRDVLPASIGLMAFDPIGGVEGFVFETMEGGKRYIQKGFCFRAEFEYTDTTLGGKSNDNLDVKTFGLYRSSLLRRTEGRGLYGLSEHFADIEGKETLDPFFTIGREDDNFMYYKGLDFQGTCRITGLASPENDNDAVNKKFVTDEIGKIANELPNKPIDTSKIEGAVLQLDKNSNVVWGVQLRLSTPKNKRILKERKVKR